MRQAFKAASLVVAGATLVLAHGAMAANNPVILPNATPTNITDINPMRMPSVGDYGLRVITPTLLELTYINSAPSGSTTPTNWNFVTGMPATSKFAVTANNSSVSVSRRSASNVVRCIRRRTNSICAFRTVCI